MKITHAIMMSAVLATAVSAAESPTEKTEDNKVLKLDAFVVTDRQDSAYKSATAITGTKTDTPLINTPQNIQVLTRELIEDMGAMDITDLYPLMGAVTEFSYGGVSARGFRQEQTRYNGIAGSPHNEFGIPTLDNVQQVELLKGPVGLLYGDNEPGGLINIVTAKPRAEFEASIGARFGDDGLIGGNAMVTGPWTPRSVSSTSPAPIITRRTASAPITTRSHSMPIWALPGLSLPRRAPPLKSNTSRTTSMVPGCAASLTSPPAGPPTSVSTPPRPRISRPWTPRSTISRSITPLPAGFA